MLVGSLLLNADDDVLRLLRHELPSLRDPGPHTAIGVVRRGVLVGGALYNNFRGFDVQVTVAFITPDWALPGTVRGLFAYPFLDLGVTRMTAIVGRKNKRSRKLTTGLGFELEGTVKRGLDGHEDAMIYGMLREKCRWLKEGRQ